MNMSAEKYPTAASTDGATPALVKSAVICFTPGTVSAVSNAPNCTYTLPPLDGAASCVS